MFTLLYDDLLGQGKLWLDLLDKRVNQDLVFRYALTFMDRIVQHLSLYLELETWRNKAHEFFHLCLLIQTALSS